MILTATIPINKHSFFKVEYCVKLEINMLKAYKISEKEIEDLVGWCEDIEATSVKVIINLKNANLDSKVAIFQIFKTIEKNPNIKNVTIHWKISSNDIISYDLMRTFMKLFRSYEHIF